MLNGWYDNVHGRLRHYINNKEHNEKCPAKIWDDGTKFWFQNYKYHRLDGPAIEWHDGRKRWYYQGKLIDCKSQQEFERYLRLKILW